MPFRQTMRRALTRAVLTAAAITLCAVSFGLQPHATPRLQPSMDVPTLTPSWDVAERAEFPGCISSDAQHIWIPAAMLVEDRQHNVRRVPYNQRQVVQVRASWANKESADDLFVIGACR